MFRSDPKNVFLPTNNGTIFLIIFQLTKQKLCTNKVPFRSPQAVMGPAQATFSAAPLLVVVCLWCYSCSWSLEGCYLQVRLARPCIDATMVNFHTENGAQKQQTVKTRAWKSLFVATSLCDHCAHTIPLLEPAALLHLRDYDEGALMLMMFPERERASFSTRILWRNTHPKQNRKTF